MRQVFADAHYSVAILNDQDQSHTAALEISTALHGVPIITTEEVIAELLAFFSEPGQYLRQSALAFVEGILSNPGIVVRQQSHHTFLDGLALYKARPDKGYSLTDCISMEAMHQAGIAEILTHDSHFTQEGFTILL
ncbi:MAG: type II toxin-antitoxin system VapC family toxin [Isosphaeraceae bacterium]